MENKDLLGLAPYGEAIKAGVEKAGDIAKLSTEKAFDAAAQFYNDICQPAAEEVGLVLKDKVRHFRAKHLASIAGKAQQFLSVTTEGLQLKAPPRLVAEVIESGSWCEDEGLQSNWAGLLASSVTPDGRDESSLIFADILKRMTSAEAKLLDYACRKSEKKIDKANDVIPFPYGASYDRLKEVSGLKDAFEIDYHVEHIGSLGLFDSGGVYFGGVTWENSPTTEKCPILALERLGLQFYVRCQGSKLSPREFFNVTQIYTDFERMQDMTR